MLRRAGWAGAAIALTLAALAVGAPTAADAVNTDLTISTTTVNFGPVGVGATAEVHVLFRNTGNDPFGPIKVFVDHEPSGAFHRRTTCLASTIEPGTPCSMIYVFKPDARVSFNDSHSFTLSETGSKSGGEAFSVSLTGRGIFARNPKPGLTLAPNPINTELTAGTTTTTTTESTATTAPPDGSDGGSDGGTDGGGDGGGAPPSPGDDGNVADGAIGADGEPTGSASGDPENVADGEADNETSETSPWLIALIAAVIGASIVGAVGFAYRRGRRSNDNGETPTPAPVSTANAPAPPDPPDATP